MAENKKHQKAGARNGRIHQTKEHRGRGPLALYERYKEYCRNPQEWIAKQIRIKSDELLKAHPLWTWMKADAVAEKIVMGTLPAFWQAPNFGHSNPLKDGPAQPKKSQFTLVDSAKRHLAKITETA